MELSWRIWPIVGGQAGSPIYSGQEEMVRMYCKLGIWKSSVRSLTKRRMPITMIIIRSVELVGHHHLQRLGLGECICPNMEQTMEWSQRKAVHFLIVRRA